MEEGAGVGGRRVMMHNVCVKVWRFNCGVDSTRVRVWNRICHNVIEHTSHVLDLY